MKVKDLRELLLTLDGDLRVYIPYLGSSLLRGDIQLVAEVRQIQAGRGEPAFVLVDKGGEPDAERFYSDLQCSFCGKPRKEPANEGQG